jgi:leucine dehydrogenase
MHFVEFMNTKGHQELAVWTDQEAGLTAFIAIHDTTLGPALGGTRIWPHATHDDAIMDVLRLSRAMTYKNAAAGLPMGGGKGLVLADPRTDKTEAMFRSYGRFVESLQGRYITTEDVGATAREMEWISHETKHVVGLPEALGGSGNPSTVTGYGVFQAMRACAVAQWGSDSLTGKTVAIQGFGNVATALAQHLLEAGAKLVVTDIFEDARARAAALPRVEIVEPDTIYDVAADVFAPCALGGVLNEDTIARLQAPIVCGAANNQLRDDADAERLQARGVLWAPDYIANAGGVINVYHEIIGPYDREASLAQTARIFDTTARVLQRAHDEGITTLRAADDIAEQRIAAGRD